MIRATFRYREGQAQGFSLVGHAGAGIEGEDIVCAAVSSAAYMTANTLTEICGVRAAAAVKDGEMSISFAEKDACAQAVLDGFLLHMQALQEQYPTRIQVQKMEV